MKKIFVHGLGQKAESWNKTAAGMENSGDILYPNLSAVLDGKKPSYQNLYSSFAEYCNKNEGQIDLCGISLGGILALNYTLDFPQKVNSLVLIGTPYKIPKIMLGIQSVVFRFLPKALFETTTFSKKDTFVLTNSMKEPDFSDTCRQNTMPHTGDLRKKDSANIKSAHDLSEKIANAKLKIIENAGHIVNEETPEQLASVLTEYYNAIQSNGKMDFNK